MPQGKKQPTPYELAQKEVGTVEWAQGDNPKVVAYFRDAGHPGQQKDETAWCAAFVGAMLKRAGLPNSGSLLARSYLAYGDEVKLADAEPGDIAVFKRGKSTWQGHVAFFVKNHGAFIEVLGGNQADAVNQKKYRTADLLGIRRIPVPQDTRPGPAPTPVTSPSPWWQRIVNALLRRKS